MTITTGPTLPSGTVDIPYKPVELKDDGGCGQAVFNIQNNNDIHFDIKDNTILFVTPERSGYYSITAIATDACNYHTSKLIHLTIRKPIRITTDRLNDGLINEPYKMSFNATGGNEDYTWAISDSIPIPDLRIDPNKGILHGIPLKTVYGPIVISVSDSEGRIDFRSYTIQIVKPLTLTLNKFPIFVEGINYSFPISTDGGVSPYTFGSVRQLPEHLNLNSKTGVISGVLEKKTASYRLQCKYFGV
ncbi:hypothetical protein MHK_001461 [Candidatus Magnetomorum sp. HK-1]|nr:hypothetical protein MHK_001461 [Candidatus Magnetomorum sp. HK-1]